MVKSLLSIFVAFSLIASLAVIESVFVRKQFSSFGREVETLIQKVEEETASVEDAKAVQKAWERRKQKVHIMFPHNDILRLDDYMAEAVSLIGEREFAFALAKLEVIRHITKCLPDGYRPALENIL